MRASSSTLTRQSCPNSALYSQTEPSSSRQGRLYRAGKSVCGSTDKAASDVSPEARAHPEALVHAGDDNASVPGIGEGTELPGAALHRLRLLGVQGR